MKEKLIKLLKKIIYRESLTQKMRRYGATIGDHVVFYSPDTCTIDFGRAYLISIGDYCKFTDGVVILAHDYSKSVPRRVYGENRGGVAPVSIGNNCFFGINSIVLMGTTIGNNCIIGAGAVVKGAFPDNVVIAGNPARVVSTLEEYYQRITERDLKDAVSCVKHIYHTTDKIPDIRQLGNGHAWLYLPHTRKTVEDYPEFFQLSGDDNADLIEHFLGSEPLFGSYEEFIQYALSADP